MENNCPNCHKAPGIHHPVYGLMVCKKCKSKAAKLEGPGDQPEFTTEFIKSQRREFADDIEQPHYKGKLNKKWVELYGAQAARNQGYTEKEIRDATYVYDGVPGVRYYNDKT